MSKENVKIFEIDFKKRKKRTSIRDSEDSDPAFYKGFTDVTMRELKERFSNAVTEEECRNKAIFTLMSKTGLRAKEVTSLRFSDMLKGPSGEVLIRFRKKGGKNGYSVLSEEILTAIRDYHGYIDVVSDHFFLSRPKRHQKQRTPLTTRSLQRIINSWNVQTCHGKKSHPHAIRHTVGQKLLEKAGSIAAQKVLGHSTPLTTSKFYTKPYFDGSVYLNW
ncbi:tyrosine-type recombinase/integrase [Leptospira santarosai]|uniref:tyrosine-type recombinase/integrase n=1 Tax=Leptospira santarosai TaxID=28183 RepID=UPI0024AF2D71|nr:tyrosine-type recombinase/integrase [Leptospira santarosai]MDI7226627.1 tyrosine-type recombinase/integrase [Leptospira santarosai]